MNVEAIIAKLTKEQYETSDPKHSVTDLASRRGWNARANELITWLRIEAGLTELAQNAPAIDTRFKSALTGFDVSDEGGEK